MSTTSAVAKVAQDRVESRVGSSAGNATHPSYFDAMDLNTAKGMGQRFALAMRLSVYGARSADAEGNHCGRPLAKGDITIMYSVAETAADVRAEFDGWGEIVELRALRNDVGATTGTDNDTDTDAHGRASDALCQLCQRCWYSVTEVGPLAPYAIDTLAGTRTVRVCEACRDAHAAAVAVRTQHTTGRALIGDVARLFGLVK